MLTFYDSNYYTEVIKDSKPLRDKFKFVMVKIAEKWLKTLRKQRKDWDIENRSKDQL